MWTGLVWLRIGTGGELLWIRYWTFGFHEMLGNYRVVSRIVLSGVTENTEYSLAVGGNYFRMHLLFFYFCAFNVCFHDSLASNAGRGAPVYIPPPRPGPSSPHLKLTHTFLSTDLKQTRELQSICRPSTWHLHRMLSSWATWSGRRCLSLLHRLSHWAGYMGGKLGPSDYTERECFASRHWEMCRLKWWLENNRVFMCRVLRTKL
jgi:hypothetical protein